VRVIKKTLGNLVYRDLRKKVIFVFPRLNRLELASIDLNFDLLLQFLFSVLQSPFSYYTDRFSHFLSAATIYNNVIAYSIRPSVSASKNHSHSFPLMSSPLLKDQPFCKLLL